MPTTPRTFLARLASTFLLGLATLATAPAAQAQEWPTRPVTIVVPYSAGGGADAVARLLAQEVSKRVNQQVLVDNKPGANGNVGTALVAKAAPDGHTLLLVPPNPIINSKLLYKNLPYDPDRDLTPVMKLVESPFAVMAFPGRHGTIQGLMAQAKASPGVISVGSAGAGSSGHLLAAMIETYTGVRFNMIPFKGSAQIVSELMTGRIDMAVDYPSAYMGQIESRAIRVLATLGSTRSPFMPDVPTMAESGFPQVQGIGWFSLHASRGVPDAVVTRIHRAFSDALAVPAVRTQLTALGYTVVTNTPSELKALMRSESTRLAEVLKTAKISLD